MKRIGNWVVKLGAMWIGLIVCFLIGIIAVNAKNEIIYTFYLTIAIPIVLYLIQFVLIVMRDNNGFNIDICMKNKTEEKIIWHLPDMLGKTEGTYLVVENVGKVDIFETFLKIEKIDGGVLWYEILDYLPIGKKFAIKVPYEIKEIDKVVVSGSLQTEMRTKKFSGTKSCDGKSYIFSNVKMFEKEKDAIIYEHERVGFKTLERFFAVGDEKESIYG